MCDQLDRRDMESRMYFSMFRYTKYYHKMQGQEIVMDLFNDEDAKQVLKVGRSNEQHARMADFFKHALQAGAPKKRGMAETGGAHHTSGGGICSLHPN